MIVKKNNGPSVLLWLDLEMTGLDIGQEFILEVASIVTDIELNIKAHGPELVIHQPREVLDKMGQWCKNQHKKSGLTDAVVTSTITVQQAEQETLAFIKKHAKPDVARLCGNSIWQDRLFLQKFMPQLLDYLNYRMIDVSAIKEVIKGWYPNNPKTEFKKKDLHRALPDVLESVEELKHYRNIFFKKIIDDKK